MQNYIEVMVSELLDARYRSFKIFNGASEKVENTNQINNFVTRQYAKCMQPQQKRSGLKSALIAIQSNLVVQTRNKVK